MLTFEVMNWEDYRKGVLKIVGYLKESNFKPELIIAIARGGIVLSVHLSHLLNCREVGFIFLKKTLSDDAFALPSTSDIKYEGTVLPEKLPDNILLIDDIIGYGHTMEEAEKVLRERRNDVKIKKIALVVNEGLVKERGLTPDKIVDFYVFSSTKDKWIIFPWEYDGTNIMVNLQSPLLQKKEENK